ncbi:MAG: hypothetical protein JWN76_727 [Chitinophagaceae bacterium]|nr:hypothetical protein [Chitinophagaceae bacterium]
MLWQIVPLIFDAKFIILIIMRNKFSILVIVSLISIRVFSQDSSQHHPYFKIGSSYLSNAVYSGRRDSATVPYLYAEADYYTKGGFYIGSKMAFLVKPGLSQLDNISLDAGYSFDLTKKLSGGLYASHSFYNDSSFAVMSTITASGGGYLTYELPFISLTAGSYLEFASKTDISTSLSASHHFDLSYIGISPSVEVNAGTQNFYKQYYAEKKVISQVKNSNKGKGSSNSGSGSSGGSGNSGSGSSGSGGTSTVTTTVQTLEQTEASTFKVLDYEIKIPVTAEKGKFEFFFTPVYAIPVHPATIVSTTGTVVKTTETLHNSFFAELGVSLKLGK